MFKNLIVREGEVFVRIDNEDMVKVLKLEEDYIKSSSLKDVWGYVLDVLTQNNGGESFGDEVRILVVKSDGMFDGYKESTFRKLKYKDDKKISQDYYVSEGGDIYSLFSRKFLKISDVDVNFRMVDGRVETWDRRYPRVDLPLEGGGRTRVYIHHAVAYTFIGERGLDEDGDYLDIDHIDNNPMNNHYTNLQFITRAENIQKRVNSILDASKVRSIRELVLEGVKVKELAEKYGVTPSTIYSVVREDSWSNIV